ncbi:unnamed protein product [Moneuplotes crassus]|uniref:Uncharacterized protein n=1 Tax=Euplotes crassus TaxID=5936 RepID=A0AAD2D4F3_EUPCR|nr:unnamed protein product [Moneuplotes crassus]
MDGLVRIPKSNSSNIRSQLDETQSDDPHVPPNFFDDTYLLPSFYMPENKELLVHTHNSIRRTLFSSTFMDIKFTEYKRLKEDDDFFEFKDLQEAEEGFFNYYNDHYLQPERNYRLLDVQTWTFNRNGINESKYLVKFYHTDKDEFRSKIYPQNWIDYFRMRWHQRKILKLV